jgi:4-hydroxybenzoate polyprenyltransferase
MPNVAMSKQRAWWWISLLGLLSLIGLWILAVLAGE